MSAFHRTLLLALLLASAGNASDASTRIKLGTVVCILVLRGSQKLNYTESVRQMQHYKCIAKRATGRRREQGRKTTTRRTTTTTTMTTITKAVVVKAPRKAQRVKYR